MHRFAFSVTAAAVLSAGLLTNFGHATHAASRQATTVALAAYATPVRYPHGNPPSDPWGADTSNDPDYYSTGVIGGGEGGEGGGGFEGGGGHNRYMGE